MLITPNGDKDNPPQIVDKSKQALLCTPESWPAVSPKAGCRRTALSQFPRPLLQVKTLGWGDFVSNRDYRRETRSSENLPGTFVIESAEVTVVEDTPVLRSKI